MQKEDYTSKNNNLRNPDIIWREIKLLEKDTNKLVDELKLSLTNNMCASKFNIIYNYISKLTKGSKATRILDYGCGGGTIVTYLRLLGYENIVGIDINKGKLYNLDSIHRKMGFNKDVFFSYDGVSLPLKDASFDLIISQQVIEHVHNVEKYFNECNRVLDFGGKILLDFPHRLVPFDTHTRMWFVHYLPFIAQKYIYNRYRGDDFSNKLNLKPLWFYKKLLNKMFSSVECITSDRISSFSYRKNYEGNIVLRSAVNILFNIPLAGKYINKFLSIFFNATLIVSK